MKLDTNEIKTLVRDAIEEDVGSGDITSRNLIPPTEEATARIIARSNGIVSGLAVARQVFKTLDRKCIWRAKLSDGDSVRKGRSIAIVKGLARAILAGERTALNFLQHMSGIATLTHRFVRKARYTETRIYDTRKTLPGLRVIEKYADKCGGGYSFRKGLFDMVLIKNNHLKICKQLGLPLDHVVRNLRIKVPRGIDIEIEARTIREVELGIRADMDIIMLDNMDYNTIKKAISIIRKSGKPIEVEVSGGINLKNVEKIAKFKIDRISVGALTHSAPVLDVALEIISVD